MKLRGNHRLWIAASVSLFIAGPASAQSSATRVSRLNAVLREASLPAGSYGIEVRELASGKVLFETNADKALNPASTIKVLTSATALSRLGPNYRFKTIVARAGNDICLIGGGDPALVNETLWMLVEETRRSGIADIAGNLIADETLFPTLREHTAEFSGDEDRAFTAPVSSLSINFNSLTIYAQPTELGKPAKIMLDPDLPQLFRVKNLTKTSSQGVKRDLDASIDESEGKFVVTVSGKVGKNNERLTIYRAVPKPPLYAAHVFAEHFRRAGGKIGGKITARVCPSNRQSIVEFESNPLSHVVYGLNKFSNNFIAEMLLRAIGKQPTAASGVEAMKEWLKTSSIPTPGLLLENGSGLSRETRIAPHTITEIIRTAANDIRIGPEFLSSLGIGGIDGTLRRRFNGTFLEGRVRAKSGSLSGVVSLAGVAGTREAGLIVFCFIFNGTGRPTWDIQKLEEKFLATLAD